MISYVKICLECLQELSYLNFFITGKANMTYWSVTDEILTETVNFGKCSFLKFCLSLVG